MRRVLYITPYFPPQSRVGALRPLKLVRRLPHFGWEPVVLADLWKGARTVEQLDEAVPVEATVIRDYSRRARGAERLWQSGTWPEGKHGARSQPGRLERLLPDRLNNPELVPLGEHSWHMPHAIRAAKRAVRAHDCEAILVNADPYAGLMVGAHVASRTGIPFVGDLRDPWSLCDLRRGRRPPAVRTVVDKLERRAIEASARYVLNTETTCSVYRKHFVDIDPDRFTFIRNAGDAQLVSAGSHAGFDRFTVLFLGSLRRFVEGDVLLEALANLQARGVTSDQLQVVVTGGCPPATWAAAERLGVDALIHLHPPVPYREIGALMDAADVLFLLSHDTQQRIPSKLYDYATTTRPIVLATDNLELDELQRQLGGCTRVGLSDASGLADAIAREMKTTRRRNVPRNQIGLDADTMAEKMAAVLDEALERRG